MLLDLLVGSDSVLDAGVGMVNKRYRGSFRSEATYGPERVVVEAKLSKSRQRGSFIGGMWHRHHHDQQSVN